LRRRGIRQPKRIRGREGKKGLSNTMESGLSKGSAEGRTILATYTKEEKTMPKLSNGKA